MGSAAVLVALVVLVAGGFVGWHLRHAYGANSDLKVHKNRIPNFRKTRNGSGLTSILLVLASCSAPYPDELAPSSTSPDVGQIKV